MSGGREQSTCPASHTSRRGGGCLLEATRTTKWLLGRIHRVAHKSCFQSDQSKSRLLVHRGLSPAASTRGILYEAPGSTSRRLRGLTSGAEKSSSRKPRLLLETVTVLLRNNSWLATGPGRDGTTDREMLSSCAA